MASFKYYTERRGRVLSRHRRYQAALGEAYRIVRNSRSMKSVDVIQATAHGDYILGVMKRDGDEVIWSPV